MQLDVHRTSGPAAEFAPYLVVLQHDRSRRMQSVVVAPLIPFDPHDDLGRLTPRVDVEGHHLLISVSELFTMDRARLGATVTNLDPDRDRIVAALDLLFTGV